MLEYGESKDRYSNHSFYGHDLMPFVSVIS